MSVSFKAFLYESSWHKDPVEIRRFNVDQDASASYTYLLQKLAQVFPSVTTQNTSIAWKDDDGDLISISSDEELVEALDKFDGSLFRIYLLKRSKPGSNEARSGCHREGGSRPHGPQRHWGIICDGCNGPVVGVRFKCLVCADYDLCSACEGKGVHVDHNMITITEPGSYHPWGPHGFAGCRGPPFGGPGWGPWGGRGRCGWQGRRPSQCGPFHAGSESKCGQTCGTKESGAVPEPMDVDQHKDQIRNIGQAVSSFLQPFGIKVDVDVVEKATEGKGAEASPGVPAKLSSEEVSKALAQLKAMGYDDDGGWLTELVKAKGGDITKVLDALHFTETD